MSVPRIPRRTVLTGTAGLGLLATLPAVNARAAGAQPYPVGSAFPIGWYAVLPSEMATIRSNGAGISHIYAPDDIPMSLTYLDQVDAADLTALCRLPLATTTEPYQMPPTATATQVIVDRVSKPVAWWDIPEEMRYWYSNEMAVVTGYAALTRQHDPLQRPNYMYTPNHYLAKDLAKYVPYLDILPVSAYRSYAGMPPAWVRWRVQQMHEAAAQAGAVLGPDHLAGEKTITVCLELFATAGKPVKTANEARHDFWATITAGAKGMMFYSWAHRTDDPALAATLTAYQTAISTLLNTPGLAPALLSGTPVAGATTTVVSGPTTAAPFQPYKVTAPITLPSYEVRAVRHLGHEYVIATNSADQPITLQLSGLTPYGGDNGTVTVTIDPQDVVILTR